MKNLKSALKTFNKKSWWHIHEVIQIKGKHSGVAYNYWLSVLANVWGYGYSSESDSQIQVQTDQVLCVSSFILITLLTNRNNLQKVVIKTEK